MSSESRTMQMPAGKPAAKTSTATRDRTDRTKDRVTKRRAEPSARSSAASAAAPESKAESSRPNKESRRADAKESSSIAEPKRARKAEESSDKSSSSRRVKAKTEKRIPDAAELVLESIRPSMEDVPITDAPGDATIEMLLRTGRKGPLLREELSVAFDTLMARIEGELTQTREYKKRDVNVRVWRSMLKDIKKIKSASLKSMKKSKKVNSTEKNISGFMKPVHISEEMAAFTGWDPEILRTRVDVTNFVCSYIKENDLQNPRDKREILSDQKLRTLLDYDPKTDDKPLTYCYIQKKIQHHFKSADAQ
jgi:hypothetical protein